MYYFADAPFDGDVDDSLYDPFDESVPDQPTPNLLPDGPSTSTALGSQPSPPSQPQGTPSSSAGSSSCRTPSTSGDATSSPATRADVTPATGNLQLYQDTPSNSPVQP